MTDTPTIYDAVIVGGSITGLPVAYEILAKNPSAKILILDKGVIGESVGGRSGGHIVLGLDGFGEDHPNRQAINRLVLQGHQHLLEVIRSEKIDCDLSMNYALLGNGNEPHEMQQFLLGSFGYPKDFIKAASSLKNAGLGFRSFSDTLQTDMIGQLNPAKYLEGLAATIKNKGGEIRENTTYEGSHWNGEYHVVKTQHGEIKTKALVEALGANNDKAGKVYTASLTIGPLDPRDREKILKGGKPLAFCDANLAGDVIWGSMTPDGRLVIGFGEFKDYPSPAQLEPLRSKLLEILPKDIADKVLSGHYKPEVTAGPLSVTENLLPIVGRPDMDTPSHYVTTGFAGRAISQAWAAAGAIAEDVTSKRPNADSNLKLFETLNLTRSTRRAPSARPVPPAARS